ERKIECPALFLSGEYDPVTKFGAEYERMDQWVPRVQKIEIPNCGHWIQQEAPQQVTEQMLEFLNDFK
ncbi:MAG: alpha/beta hydrolase, partial [Pseudomonadota bacterium]|nr:alpha/beta hydrolase [Pseudomonadota bacterium]